MGYSTKKYAGALLKRIGRFQEQLPVHDLSEENLEETFAGSVSISVLILIRQSV